MHFTNNYKKRLSLEPSPPMDFALTSNSSRGIVISWLPPENPNGLIIKYELYMKEEREDLAFQDQRDYCKGRKKNKRIERLHFIISPLLSKFVMCDLWF